MAAPWYPLSTDPRLGPRARGRGGALKSLASAVPAQPGGESLGAAAVLASAGQANKDAAFLVSLMGGGIWGR